MFWIDPKYLPTLQAASAADYDALVQLRAMDHFVEKQGRSTGRYVVAAAGSPLSFFLKKYYRVPWWQSWFIPLQDYPGPRELANLQRAAALGIPVPEPLAAGADRNHACRSLLAVRELTGYRPLHEFIPARLAGRDTPERRALRRVLTDRLADIARRLHTDKLYHCDLYLCHFFIREGTSCADTPLPQPLSLSGRGAGVRRGGSDIALAEKLPSIDLVLIDLMRLKQSPLPRWQIKDLAQLLYSSDLPGITRTDRLRFFKRYLGLARLDGTARRLLRRILHKAARYHRHNAVAARKAAA